MKRVLCIFCLAAALLSCSKEDIRQNGNPGQGASLSACIEEAQPSEEGKTSLSPANANYWVLWSQGDEISVNGRTYRLISGAHSNQAKFAPANLPASAPYVAIYPAAYRISETSINLPATRTYQENNLSDFPMYASNMTDTLSFRNLCGLIRLNLSGAGQVASLVLSADQPLSGTATLEQSGMGPQQAVIKEGAGTVTLQFPAPMNLSGGKSVLIYAPIGNFTSLTLKMTNTVGYECHRSSTKAITVARNEITDINLSGLTFDRCNGHRFVDLGLPSELRWCATNVGADATWKVGDYFAWGAIAPYYTTLSPLSWKSDKTGGYILGNAPYYSGSAYTKYDTAGASLESSDDAAAATWGSPFRLATEGEWRELIQECYWLRTDQYNGHAGGGFLVFKAKAAADKNYRQWTPGGSAPSASTYGVNDPHIFLPFGGFFDGTTLTALNQSGCYYTSSTESSGWKSADSAGENACMLWFQDGMGLNKDYFGRYQGYSLRPVKPKTDDETK